MGKAALKKIVNMMIVDPQRKTTVSSVFMRPWLYFIVFIYYNMFYFLTVQYLTYN